MSECINIHYTAHSVFVSHKLDTLTKNFNATLKTVFDVHEDNAQVVLLRHSQHDQVSDDMIDPDAFRDTTKQRIQE